MKLYFLNGFYCMNESSMYKLVKELEEIKKRWKKVKALYILFKQNRLSNIILIAASIVFFAIVYFVILHSTYTSNSAVAGTSLDGQNRYNISVIEKSPTVENLYNFNQVLQANSQVTVYTATPVETLIKDFSGDIEFTPPEAKQQDEFSPVYGIQMNKAAQKMNNITMDTGRFFNEKEFENYNPKKTMPVVLGSSYFNLYDLDEKIQLQVHGQEVTAQIIGFLKADQIFVTTALSQMSAAHQVVIPAQIYKSIPKETNTFAQQNLFASANTMLVTTATKIGIRDIMFEVSKESDYWNFAVGGAGGFTVNLYNTMIKANPVAVYTLFLLAIVAMFILVKRIQPSRNKNNRVLFRILTNSGMTRKEVEKFIIIEITIILAIGILLPVLPFLVISQMALLTAVLYIVISVLISSLFILLVRKKTVIETE